MRYLGRECLYSGPDLEVVKICEKTKTPIRKKIKIEAEVLSSKKNVWVNFEMYPDENDVLIREIPSGKQYVIPRTMLESLYVDEPTAREKGHMAFDHGPQW